MWYRYGTLYEQLMCYVIKCSPQNKHGTCIICSHPYLRTSSLLEQLGGFEIRAYPTRHIKLQRDIENGQKGRQIESNKLDIGRIGLLIDA